MPNFVNAFAPGASVLSVRGAVAWEGGWAFFKRNADRSLDEFDLVARTNHLEEFLQGTVASQLGSRRVYLCGCSNGAIMGASLVLSAAIEISGAVLLRPEPPFRVAPVGARPTAPVLIIDGAEDDRRRPDDGTALAFQLQALGAAVCRRIIEAGHAPTTADIEIIRRWLKQFHPPATLV